MQKKVYGLTPILNSIAGSCLTQAEWARCSISAASFYLDDLLLKPGLSALRNISSIKEYLNWPGTLILNATQLKVNKEGNCIVKSPYDGSKTTYALSELLQLIRHLSPDAVVLPQQLNQIGEELWADWSDSILPIISVDELETLSKPKSFGVYFTQAKLADLDKWTHTVRYVLGDIGYEQLKKLAEKGVDYVESDRPADDAFNGRIYSHSGLLELTKEQFSTQFQLLDALCDCDTCTQKLTQAYLHHLLAHTPLLCQRFLIQHNVHLAQRPFAIDVKS